MKWLRRAGAWWDGLSSTQHGVFYALATTNLFMVVAFRGPEAEQWAITAVGFAFGAFIFATFQGLDTMKRDRRNQAEAARMIELLESIDSRLAAQEEREARADAAPTGQVD